MTALQKTLASALLVAALSTAIYQARRASQWRDQVQILESQQSAAAEQIERLRSERDEADNRLARLKIENAPSKGDTSK